MLTSAVVTLRILHFASNKNLNFSANNESLSGKFDQEMKRNVKDTYNSPNYPVADPGCQIWLGGGGGGAVIQTLRAPGEGGFKKNLQPFGLQFRLKGWVV